jgi:hypothetical protein
MKKRRPIMKSMTDNLTAKPQSTSMANPFVIAVVCALLLMTVTYAFSAQPANQTSIKAKEEEPVAVARRVLSRLPITTADRLAGIKDAKVRGAAERAHRLLKALADNKDKSKEDGLIKQFDQAYLTLVTEGQKGGYQSCTFKCKSDTQKCLDSCKKRFCGCKLTGFGCFIAECLL